MYVIYFVKTTIEIIIRCGVEYTNEEKLVTLEQFHASKSIGHSGINKIIKKIKQQFNWLHMKQDVYLII